MTAQLSDDDLEAIRERYAGTSSHAVHALLAEVDRLRADLSHWKAHAQEAGDGFARVCRDYSAATARASRLRAELDALASAADFIRSLLLEEGGQP